MKQSKIYIVKIFILLIGFSFSGVQAQNSEHKILETEYNNSGQLFYIAPHPSWSKSSLIELPTILGGAYGISSNFTLKAFNEESIDKFTITKTEQMIGKYPVVGGDLILKRDKSGSILSIIGVLRDPSIISEPLKSVEEIFDIAHKFLKITDKDYFNGGEGIIAKPEIALKYTTIGGIITNKVILCYEFKIMTKQPAEWYVYINASDGKIEYSYNGLPHANGSGTTLYSGNKNINTTYTPGGYRLVDSVRNIFTMTWRNTKKVANRKILNDPNNSFDSSDQQPGVEAHWGMGVVYDYYLNTHGRKSFDGKGVIIKNNVRYDSALNNAFFANPPFNQMYYGKGNGVRWSDLVALDVLGHELTHAVISTCGKGLIYRGESGALNESIADIFGHCIEVPVKGLNWLMGEDCFTPGVGGDALRSLSNPNSSGDAAGTGKQPDTYKGTHWASTSGGDDGGVHTNSGVQNFWFYLLTVGGSGTNDAPLSHAYSVTGIGQANSEAIVYHALKNYMASTSDYKAARKAMLLAAEDKHGKKSNQYKQVCNAWYAVGVGEKCCDTMELEFKVKDTKCHNSKDGEIELTVKKAKGPFTYRWYKGDTSTAVISTSKDIVALDSGRYAVIVKDTVAKCELMDKTKVKSPEKLKVSVSGGGTYHGACERSFTVPLTASASGGTPNYTYNWSNGLKNVVCSGGNGFSTWFTAVATDKNGCKADKSALVTYIPVVCSYDPNEIIGPPSYSDNKWVSVNANLPYKILYENDPKFATGPAQKVTISHKLDTNTDATSFRLGTFGFYKYAFGVPKNSSTYSNRLDLRDSFGIYLDVTAGLDLSTREAFWIFESIDPATGIPPTDGHIGFLGINDSVTHKGEGFVNYNIVPKSTSITGDSIRAKATIVFDDNPEVLTPRIFNLIDAVAPKSFIKSVPPVIDSTIVNMVLRGKDDTGGSGLDNFDIYVSTNGGAYNLYASNITDTLINFKGDFGSSYKAYSISYDNTNNKEGKKRKPEISFSIASKDFFKPIPSTTSFCAGDTMNIEWYRSFFPSVNLEYSADSGKTYNSIATNLSGTQMLYKWKVPENIIGVKKYFLRSLVSGSSAIIDSSDYFTLKQGPVFNLGPDSFICDKTTFSIVLNPGSGYTSYKWSDSTTNQTKTVTTYGTYSVKITASTGCIASDEIAIIKNLLPVISSVSMVSPKCNGGSDGSIDITVVSGSAPYKYLWSNTKTTQDLANILAGKYIVNITDTVGCKLKDSVTLTQPTIISATASQTNVACNGASTGSATVTASGGTGTITYSWSPSGGTGATASSLAAGTYVCTLKDANNCSITKSFTITEPAALTATTSQTNVACNGASTGSATVTASGGTGTITYSWSPSGGTGATASSLTVGTYVCTIKDANTCSITKNFTITEPSAITATTAQTNVACNGGNTGSATVNATGGTGALTYSWSPSGGSGATASSLTIGNYVCTIKDANNCTITKSFTITEPTALTATTSQTNVACNGASTGSATVTASGGTGTITYAWSPSGGTGATASSLAAGTYVCTIKDGNNCTITKSFTITEPSAITASTSQNNVLCNGASTGSATVTASGGTGTLTYSWSPSGGSGATASSLAAGNYTCTITDANSCVLTKNFTITEPSAITATTAQTDVLCNGASTGSATVSANGGTGTLTYAWAPSGGTGATASSLKAGTYVCTIKDANNCIITKSFTITEPTILAKSRVITDVKCFAGNDGTVNITITGGVTPYTFAWSNSATTEDISSLTAGTYSVIVTDKNACVIRDTSLVNQPTKLVKSRLITTVKCFGGNDGAVNLTITGGSLPYTYLWNNAATTEDLSTLKAGTYAVVVTDKNNCIIRDTAIITEPTKLLVSRVISNVKCHNGSDGGINITVTGGVIPYIYSWNSGDISEDVSTKKTGWYKVTVTDKNFCKFIDSGFISQPLAPLTSGITMVPVNCFAGSDGSANLTIAGGTVPYTYSWSNSKNTEDISNLILGKYLVNVTDFNNCKLLDSILITQPAAPLLTSIVRVDVKCFGDATGSANLSVSGGTSPYIYSWSNASTNEDISTLISGKYVISITDKNLCTSKDSVNIQQPNAPLSTTITASAVNCFGGNNGTVALNVAGGTSPYTYAWSNGASSKDINALILGKYKVVVTDFNNCIIKDSVVVIQPAAPLAATHVIANAKCNGSSNGGIDLSVSGGTVPYGFSWNKGQITEDLSGQKAGRYLVTITDKNLCTLKDSGDITEPTTLVSTTDGTSANIDASNGKAWVEASGGTLPYSYVWSNGAPNNDTIYNLKIGSYIVTVTDANGCSRVDTFIVLEAPKTQTIKLYPNPIREKSELTIEGLESFGLDLPIHFELFDNVGKLQESFDVIGVDKYTFRLSENLFNNAYILRMSNDRFREIRKVYLLR